MKKLTILLVLFLSFTFLDAQSLRIESKELLKNFDEYKILDAREQKDFLENHIKNALSLSSVLTYDNQLKNGKITSPDIMQKILRILGLDVNDKIVIYDKGDFFEASRVFWALEVYGFKNLKLLNEGFKEWKKLKHPTSEKSYIPKKSNYVVSINHNKLATKLAVQIATKNPNQIIIDARPEEYYQGLESTAKRYGHIPTAVNIPAEKNLTENKNKLQKLKDSELFKNIYKNINKDKKVVVYCSIARISSLNYFALRELGYNVANYDSSWREWAADFKLPVENPSLK